MLFTKKFRYLAFLLIVIGSFACLQIVNIEWVRMHAITIGWMGNAGASFLLTKNAIQVFSSDPVAHIQDKSNKILYLFLCSYGFLKGGGDKLEDYSFLHFRYNYKINKTLRWEPCTQSQNNIIT